MHLLVGVIVVLAIIYFMIRVARRGLHQGLDPLSSRRGCYTIKSAEWIAYRQSRGRGNGRAETFWMRVKIVATGSDW
jgi:hypothetical protein